MPADSKRSRSYRKDNDGEAGTWKRRNNEEINMEKTTDALSKNQQKFVFDAEDQGFDVDYEFGAQHVWQDMSIDSSRWNGAIRYKGRSLLG